MVLSFDSQNLNLFYLTINLILDLYLVSKLNFGRGGEEACCGDGGDSAVMMRRRSDVCSGMRRVDVQAPCGVGFRIEMES